MTAAPRVAVAMSGGVDSSVSAALLKKEGFDIFGIMLRLWSPSPDTPNRCCSPDDLAIAEQVAAQLQIPFFSIDASDQFKEKIVDPFIYGYAHGITPNPCLNCNRFIRWGFLLDQAIALGATHLVTGHYARILQDDGPYRLLRATDHSKDQSYILSFLNQRQLAHTLLPLGALKKMQVREFAHTYQLPSCDRPESQDLCFLGDMDYRTFLKSQGVSLPPGGLIEDSSGNRLGEHQGLAGYTIGQRKGLGIASTEALYVIHKDLVNNRLIVGSRNELGRDELIAGDLNWISGQVPQEPIRALTRIRYKSREVQSTLYLEYRDQLRIKLDEPLPDITPGQAAVFYQEQVCLGGGLIRA